MSEFSQMMDSYPNNEIKRQVIGLYLTWDKEVCNFTIEDMKEMREKIINRKLAINYEPIKYWVEMAITKGFSRAKIEMYLDLTPSMILEKMGGMFGVPKERTIETIQEENKAKIKEKAVKEIEIIEISDDSTILQVLTKIYGKEASAKTFITKNKLIGGSKDWKIAVEMIANSTSKFKKEAKQILESKGE